ncbi:Calcium-dependent protein kinase 1, partial [Zea mays]
GDRREPVRGRDRGAEGDVQDDRRGQQRADHVRGAQGGAEEGGRQPPGVGDLRADASCGRGQQRHDRLRRVHRGHAAPEQGGAGGPPVRGVPVLRQGRQRIHHRRRAAGGVRGVRPGRRPAGGRDRGGRPGQRRPHRLQRVRRDDAEAAGGSAQQEGRPAEQLQHRVQGGTQDGLTLNSWLAACLPVDDERSSELGEFQ